MTGRNHRSEYDNATTERCERTLLTLIGDIGPWSDRLFLVGGLAPRYIVGQLPLGVEPHVGTTDVDFVIGLTVDDESSEAYRTLQNNLEKAEFLQLEPSFRWSRDVDGMTVIVEFLCETDQVDRGRIFRPKGEHTGSKLGAINVEGAQLVRYDYLNVEIEGERLDGGGLTRIEVHVANVLPYSVLKVLAFQDRHENKDSYDLIFTLLNYEGGPEVAARVAARSPISDHPQVERALELLRERFSDVDRDGPVAYSMFLGDPDDDDELARLRREAVAVVREFFTGWNDRT